MHVSIMDRSPSNTASTLPSHRFSTYPSSPNDSAFSAQYARKFTPCTRPRKTTTARTFTSKRNETTRKNFTGHSSMMQNQNLYTLDRCLCSEAAASPHGGTFSDGEPPANMSAGGALFVPI